MAPWQWILIFSGCLVWSIVQTWFFIKISQWACTGKWTENKPKITSEGLTKDCNDIVKNMNLIK